jgi:hypothetical protein
MKHQWLAYVIVGLLSIGAGVAIAGLPDNVPVDATIIPPTTTEAPSPTLPETTVATTTVPPTTEPETTEPSESTVPETTEPDDTTPDDTTPVELGDRDELTVVVANGANVAGAASTLADRLEELGYVDLLPLNGTDIFEFTVVYFADGFEAAALRMAEDIPILEDFVLPLDEAPSVPDLPDDVEVLVYLGRDRA